MKLNKNMENLTLFYQHKNLYVIELFLPTSFLKHNKITQEEYVFCKDLTVETEVANFTFLDRNLLLIKRLDRDNGYSLCRFIFK